MKYVNKMTIVASISIASFSSVATENTDTGSESLKLNDNDTQKQVLQLTEEDVQAALLVACPRNKCPVHGEIPHARNSIWERFKDFFGIESGAMVANNQSNKSLDDDFA